ncbi:MAG: AMIN domain-containing protein [Proteobacteria bacterium]|nr:AMIN domain-containing protein [Pseudomonadota bacterium]MBU1715556.1 AMIN domain-containing protein [Pseudomonadota bacterium]
MIALNKSPEKIVLFVVAMFFSLQSLALAALTAESKVEEKSPYQHNEIQWEQNTNEAMTFAALTTKSAEEEKSTYQINEIQWEQTADEFLLRIEGEVAPTYTMYELFDPLRVIIDIADATIGETVKLPLDLPHGPVSLVNGQVLEDKEPFIARIEIFLNEDKSYTVEREDNDIIVKFAKENSVTEMPAEEITEASIPADINTPVITEIDAQTAIMEDTIPAETEAQADNKESEINVIADNLSQPQETATELIDIEVNKDSAETRILIKADGPIKNFDKVQLKKNLQANRPERFYIDIDDIKVSIPIKEIDVGTALSKIRTARRSNGIRIVFDSSTDQIFEYTIDEQNNGLLVVIQESSPASALIANLMGEDTVSSINEQPYEQEISATSVVADDESISTEDESMVKESTPTPEKVKPTTKAIAPKVTPEGDFSFSGYTKKRITVDFFKIDLHNVFRLFGEISGLNIVVAQDVDGKLTLALNDVPWDFALDIILNLKDLQKEERFNTLVISTKSKQFTWPERQLSTIDFKQDETIIKQEKESLIFAAQKEVPETVAQSKKLVHQAQIKEKNGDYNGAISLYEEAFKKWPENSQLANQIAALALVQLEMNAKAVHFAKVALKLNPDDSDAALHAAIGSARMKKTAQAKEYFDLAVRGSQPSSEALTSYAAFTEENGDYDTALALLKRHEDYYGDSLQSMVGKARIYDKNGNTPKAVEEYRAIMLSGFEIPPDLNRYIKGRITLANQ